VTATLSDAYDLFMKGSIALAEIESAGIRIDTDYLDKTISKVSQTISDLEVRLKADDVFLEWRKAYPSANIKFGSREQLAHVVFSKGLAKYPWAKERTKSGRYRTDENTLSMVDLPFVKDWMEWVRWIKARSTYLYGLKREIVDGFVHPFFHLTSGGQNEDKGGARSFRSSSSGPNVQNLPARLDWLAEAIRRSYIARPKHRMVFRDASALEFRVASCVWADPEMIKYASDPSLDIHRDIASEMFLLPKAQVSKAARYLGKNGYVFPHLYGSWWKNIATKVWAELPGVKTIDGVEILDHLRSEGITELGNCNTKFKEEPRKNTFEYVVKQVENRFDSRFHVFRKNADEYYEGYRRTGKFKLITGFDCGGICSKNQVLNTPVQGPGFHLILWCVIQTHEELKRKKMRSLVIGEIHDDEMGDVREEELQDYLNITERIMTKDVRKAFPWVVCPLATEASCTPIEGAWSEKEPLVLDDNNMWRPKK
jgi:DNA polymerase I-like protein with 3'-5' exonuclease and polymerase domains